LNFFEKVTLEGIFSIIKSSANIVGPCNIMPLYDYFLPSDPKSDIMYKVRLDIVWDKNDNFR
jgi:hypothetical protein